ncbi:MAG: response regulator [Dissulfuribacterales bacterium]
MAISVLLVDDEPDIREVLNIVLSDSGYTVYTAENGEKALQVFKEVNPAIVLTDIKMPGMDGIELLDRIKREDPEVEVIMITGHGDMELAIQSLKKDASDFITKPINDYALETALKKAQEKILVRQKLKEYTENLETIALEKARQLSFFEKKETYAGTSQKPDNSQLLYQKILDEIPCFITILNRDFMITDANKLFNDNFGGQSTKLRCYQVCTQKNSPCINCPAIKTFGNGNPNQSIIEYISPSGKLHPVMVWATPLRNTDGVIDRILIMATPTDRLDDQYENLASLGLMVGSISHGLKGLLTGLDGGMYMLNSALEKDNTSEAKEGLAVVKTTTERIRNMVFDLLYYSKKRELKIATANVVEFANEVAAIVELKLNWQNIQFVKDFFQASGQFEVDATAFRSALVNILENAMEACLENKSKSSKISFSVKTTTDFIFFEIVDNGIGMDLKTVKNVFTLFFSTKGKQGTGLGLYIAEKVIKQHGGGITVDSQKGEGSRFTVKMPIIMLKNEV